MQFEIFLETEGEAKKEERTLNIYKNIPKIFPKTRVANHFF